MDRADTVLIEVSVERDLADQARDAGLDVAGVVNRALRETLADRNRQAPESAVKQAFRAENAAVIERRNRMIDEDGLFGQAWRSF